jgi:four helix bundle protein
MVERTVRVQRRMGAKNLDELRAYQCARAFKLEVYRLIQASRSAQSDWKFRSQLMDAAASHEMNVREGYKRFVAGEMSQFLSFALASLAEAVGWLQDGIDRTYFRSEECVFAFELGEKSDRTTKALLSSLRPFLRKHRGSIRGPREGLTKEDNGRRQRTED